MKQSGYGRVVATSEIQPVGDEVDVAASAGASLLHLDSVTEFGFEGEDATEAGGWVMLVDEDGVETPVQYLSVVEDAAGDEDGRGSLVLASPLAADVDLYTQVELYEGDPSGGALPVLEYEVLFVEDDQISGDPEPATVRTDMVDAPPAVGDAIEWEREGEADEIVVTRVVGGVPLRDGGFITPGTLPPVTVAVEPPEVPDLLMTGLPRGFIGQVTNAGGQTEHTFEVSLDGGSSWLTYDPTLSPILYAEFLPSGEAFDPPDASYVWRVTATNSAGSETSAATDPQMLVLNDSSSISTLAVGQITAGNLVGAFALLGALQVGCQISITEEFGIEIEQPDGGRIVFPADGSAASISSHLGRLLVDGAELPRHPGRAEPDQCRRHGHGRRGCHGTRLRPRRSSSRGIRSGATSTSTTRS